MTPDRDRMLLPMANVWIRIGAFGFVGVAAIITGGLAGWLAGIALLVIAARVISTQRVDAPSLVPCRLRRTAPGVPTRAAQASRASMRRSRRPSGLVRRWASAGISSAEVEGDAAGQHDHRAPRELDQVL